MNNSIVQKRLSNLKNNTIYDDLAKNIGRVQIFYDKLEQTIITEDIKTQVFDLVSGMGGTLGLFLGLSFLSLIEIVEILLQIILILFDNKSSKSNKIGI